MLGSCVDVRSDDDLRDGVIPSSISGEVDVDSLRDSLVRAGEAFWHDEGRPSSMSIRIEFERSSSAQGP